MFQRLSLTIAKHMVSDQIILENQIAVYKYGLELALSSIAGILALVVVSVLCAEPFWWLPYLVGFIPIRLLGGGYHAKSHSSCISLFTLFYVISFIGIKYYTISAVVWMLICAFDVFVQFVFAPVEANNKPLRAVQRNINRYRCLLLGILNLFFSVMFSYLQVNCPTWVTLYFAGSSMASVSIMLAVIIKNIRKE